MPDLSQYKYTWSYQRIEENQTVDIIERVRVIEEGPNFYEIETYLNKSNFLVLKDQIKPAAGLLLLKD